MITGVDMRKLYTSGLQAFGHYAVEVPGLDPKGLSTAQSLYLSICRSPSKSQNRSASLLLFGDPCWRQALAPFLTWCGIVWKARFPGQGISDIWPLPWLGNLAGDIITSLPARWSDVRGPFGAAHLSLKRVGMEVYHAVIGAH